MKKIVLLSILILFCSASVCLAGSTFRCGPAIVSVGATKSEVQGKCGEPTSKEVLGDQVSGGFTSRTREREIGDRSSFRTRGTYNERSYVLESWTYNCGPSEFSHTLTFQGQDLVGIENIGYGYGQSDCIGWEQRFNRSQQEAPARNSQSSSTRQRNPSSGVEGEALPKGNITLQGSPSGAKVYIDGAYVSSIPCVLYEIEAGTHSIEVQNKGYKSHKEWVKVRAGEVATVIIDLEQE